MVVKAAEEKAVEDMERGTSVPQPKMTQTSKKVTKDLRMDLLLDAEVPRTIKRADWYAFGQLCYTYPLFCGNLLVQGWLVWRTDESYQVAKADGCRTGYNKKKDYGYKKKKSSDGNS